MNVITRSSSSGLGRCDPEFPGGDDTLHGCVRVPDEGFRFTRLPPAPMPPGVVVLPVEGVGLAPVVPAGRVGADEASVPDCSSRRFSNSTISLTFGLRNSSSKYCSRTDE